mmetsp:Transcript_14248/g.20793  ORF Transcript_14248/g.20793 Transcript_14248/m.20793 type:complete len:231 (-) Transcript_14248:211-903(-)
MRRFGFNVVWATRPSPFPFPAHRRGFLWVFLVFFWSFLFHGVFYGHGLEQLLSLVSKEQVICRKRAFGPSFRWIYFGPPLFRFWFSVFVEFHMVRVGNRLSRFTLIRVRQGITIRIVIRMMRMLLHAHLRRSGLFAKSTTIVRRWRCAISWMIRHRRSALHTIPHVHFVMRMTTAMSGMIGRGVIMTWVGVMLTRMSMNSNAMMRMMWTSMMITVMHCLWRRWHVGWCIR